MLKENQNIRLRGFNIISKIRNDGYGWFTLYLKEIFVLQNFSTGIKVCSVEKTVILLYGVIIKQGVHGLHFKVQYNFKKLS